MTAAAVAPAPAGPAPVRWLGYGLFFLMLFVPTVYQPVKGAMLAGLVALIALAALARGRLALHPVVLLWVLFLAAVGLVFMVRGLMLQAPGALRVGTVYVLWPMVFALLIAGAADAGVMRSLARILVFATGAIGLYGLSYILHTVGWLPSALYLPLDLGQEIGLYGGFVELNLYNLSSLLFLVPFLVAALMTWAGPAEPLCPRWWLWIALLAGGTLVLLSGRRALLLVVSLAPFLALALRAALPPGDRAASRRYTVGLLAGALVAGVALVLLLQALFDFRIGSLWRMFLLGFEFDRDISAAARGRQFTALLTEWGDSPLLGAGHGASAAGSIRSTEMPWAYELSYLALLFHTGLVGFLAYASAVVWIFVAGVQMIRKGGTLGQYMLALLVGLGCFLLGNATNPYLEKYDLMWVLFLPIGLINYALLRRPGSTAGISR